MVIKGGGGGDGKKFAAYRVFTEIVKKQQAKCRFLESYFSIYPRKHDISFRSDDEE